MWLKGMQAEHCDSKDSLMEFTTLNYGITTCPSNEWKVTLTCDESLADMRHGRRLPDIEQLMQSKYVQEAKLEKCEVVSLVLYSGPMVCTPAASILHVCIYFMSALCLGVQFFVD